MLKQISILITPSTEHPNDGTFSMYKLPEFDDSYVIFCNVNTIQIIEDSINHDIQYHNVDYIPEIMKFVKDNPQTAFTISNDLTKSTQIIVKTNMNILYDPDLVTVERHLDRMRRSVHGGNLMSRVEKVNLRGDENS